MLQMLFLCVKTEIPALTLVVFCKSTFISAFRTALLKYCCLETHHLQQDLSKKKQ